MSATPAQRRAAHLAASAIEAMLLEMFVNNEYGTAAIERHPDRPHELEPVKTTTKKGRTIRVQVGYEVVGEAR